MEPKYGPISTLKRGWSLYLTFDKGDISTSEDELDSSTVLRRTGSHSENKLDSNWIIGKDPDPGKDWWRRRRGRQRRRWLDDTIDSMDMSLSKLREVWRAGKPGVLQSMGLQRVGYDWATELIQRPVLPVFQSIECLIPDGELPSGAIEDRQLQQHLL